MKLTILLKKTSTQGLIKWKLSQQSMVVTIEAFNILTNELAIKKETIHGTQDCHLRALYTVLSWAAKLALSSKVKHNNSLNIHKCLQRERGHLNGKIFCFSLTLFYYTDNKHCWKVIDCKRTCAVLEFLADFSPNKIMFI